MKRAVEPEACALARWEGGDVDAWSRRWGVPRLLLFDRVGSTNDIASALARDGAAAGTTVLAEEQSAGRGRHGRRWHAPAGRALLLSTILRPRPATAPGTLPLRAGIAVARAIESCTGARCGIEWPNDVLVDGRKVAGILCEASLGGDDGGFVVVGIGINVALEEADFPDGEVRRRATSLWLATGRPVDRGRLAGAVLRELMTGPGHDAGQLRGDVAAELARRDTLRGRVVVEPDGRRLGVGDGVDPDGALRLRQPDGSVRRLTAGSVRGASPDDPEP